MKIPTTASRLRRRIAETLHIGNREKRLFLKPGKASAKSASSVLLPLGDFSRNSRSAEPCLVMNKRSEMVAQAGDLCFPGGSVEPALDSLLARLVTLPGMPLSRWAYWSEWRDRRPKEARWLSLMMAACLRESLEEMRLNPLGVEFLGPLPPHRLRMFDKKIYPMAAWLGGQRRFYPNWEVERIVFVPLRSLLDSNNYARFRLVFPPRIRLRINRDSEDFPCFVYSDGKTKEVLWGVTFRIVETFLETVFGFRTPDMERLPVTAGSMKDDYMDHRR